MDTLAFLRAVLPEPGWKCVVHIAGQTRKQYFFETHEETAQAIVRLDKLDGNVYHGCASYSGEVRQSARAALEGWRPVRHREKQDVLWLRAFWLDIDLAPKSRYADACAAAEDVVRFCRELGLPVPLFVGSGNGLHVYWPLARDIDRLEWERYAAGLKLACDRHDLEAGRERTADCSSILRPPGAHWRKSESRLVECGPIPMGSDLSAFDCLLEFAADAPKSRNSIVPANSKSGISSKILFKPPNEKIDFEQLASNCAQLGALRLSRGLVSEPLWHASLVLLSHCHEGEKIANEWSNAHSNYSPEEVSAYVARGRERSGPTTCVHFRSINPAGCEGCKFNVATPLNTLTSHLTARSDVDSVPVVGDGTGKGTDGFLLDGGLWFRHEERNGKFSRIKVTNFGVELLHVQFGEIRTANRFYHFRHFLPHHGWQDIEVSASDPYMTRTLAGGGLNIHESDLFGKWVKGQVDMYNDKQEQQVQYEQYGWKSETSFLYGSRLYRPDATVEVPGSTELKFRNQWLMPRKGGSLDGWKLAADRLFGAGSEGQSFAVLAAFAAPLMRFTNDSEGGAIVSLVTRATGTGKSSALAGAYTVYASDRRALSLTTTDTGNSKGVAMATIGNLPIVHDEFAGDPEVTKNFVKLFTEGRDKQRLDRDGQMRHTVGTWQTILFTAANTSLVDTIGALGASDALAYRVLEFPVSSAGDFSPAEADRLRKQLELNAGWAGHAFLEYIVRPDVLEMVKAMIAMMMEEIYAYRKGVFGREHRFWVRTLACVAVAARIVEHLDLVAFSPTRIMTWAIDYFASMERPVPQTQADWLASFINAHTNEMLVVPRAWSPDDNKKGSKLASIVPPRIPTRLTIRREEDTGAYLIDYQTIKRWLIKHEISPGALIKDLTAAKIILGLKFRSLGAGTNLGGGQVKVVEVDGAHPAFSGMIREVKEEKNARTAS